MEKITREKAIQMLIEDDVDTIMNVRDEKYLRQILQHYWGNDNKETLEDELEGRWDTEYKIIQ